MSTRIRITLRAGIIVPGQFSMSFIILFYIFSFLSVIFLPLGPVSLMHRKMQNKSWHASCSCNFCGSYYGRCLMIHISFSLCCDLKLKYYILISVYCNIQSLSSDKLSGYIKAQAFSISDSFFFNWDS